MKPDIRLHLSWKLRRPAALAAVLLSLTGAVHAANPTLTAVGNLTGQDEDFATTIDYATLAAAANEADADAGDTISFRVEVVTSGVLRKGGAVVTPGATLLSPGQSWVWTPAQDANGLLPAFTVRAWDGANASAPPPVQVFIQVAAVNDAPTLTTVSDLNGAAEDNATSIPYAILDGAANAGDVDGNAISYRVETVSSGTLRKGGVTVTPGSTLLGAGESLSWTPAQDQNGLLSAFTVRAWDGALASASPVQVRIQVAPVNDAPTISGSILTTINDNAAETLGATKFLAGLTLADVEGDNITVTVRIPKSAEDIADLTLPDSTRTSSGNDYLYTYASASPGTQTARLDTAVFVPLLNAMPPGDHQEFVITITVSDGTDSSATAPTLSVVAVDDPPEVALSLSPATVVPGVDATPFRVTINDPDPGDDGAKTVTLTLMPSDPALGTLTIPAGSLTGNKAQVETGMATVKYRPNAVSAATSVVFTCAVQGAIPAVSSTATLSISFNNAPPDIAGVSTDVIRTNDDPVTPAVVPFPTVLITDPNAGQTFTATITPDTAAKGTVILPAGSLTGVTLTQLNQRLRQVTFKPAANRVPVNDTETTFLTLSISDGLATVSNSLTRVTSLSVNGAPDVTLPASALPATVTLPLNIAGETTGKPFQLVTVSDDDLVPSVTVTITMDDPAKGSLSSLGSFAPVAGSPGTYVFSGDPAVATSDLHLIEYTLNPLYSFPAGQPGLTTFTIEAKDALQNRTTLVMSIVMQNAARNCLVTLREDNALLRAGSLRRAINDAKDNDVITFAFSEYPAVLRLNRDLGPLLFTKHVRLKGPGADLLTISGDSDGNGTPDMQICQVEATVVMEGLTLTQGTAQTGGAAHVSRNQSSPANAPGSLTLSYCAITDCRATQWGGALDIEEGSLAMDHCLVKGNATDASFGLGGGAVSLYTSEACSFTATTFSGNRQRASAGYGGGAIYAENIDPQVIFPVAVTHCTFSENEDAAVRGTSIHSNVFNCRVTTRGSIFADAAQRNLHVAGSGQIFSEGRNLSNDAARTVLIQSGQPQSIVLLNQTGPGGDKVSTDPLLLPLAAGIGGTAICGLSPLSPAIGTFATVEGTDQRGVLRDTMPDSGAVEFSRTQRVVINEAQTAPAAGGFAFVEFYVPRDSSPVNLTGMSLFVNGRLRHTIGGADPSAALQPGFGYLIAEGALTASGTPVAVCNSCFWDAGEDEQRSVFELRTAGGTVLARADVVNVFHNPKNPAQTYVNNSATLAPQFRGAAYVPNSTGLTPPLGPVMDHGGSAQSPGADTGGTPFGQNNARPFASADNFIVGEDDRITLPVLSNDLDPDGLDKLVLVDVSRLRSSPENTPPVGDDPAATSFLQSVLDITPNAAPLPLRGTELWYDPRLAQNHLPAGVSATDSFFYTIVDIGAGPVSAYAANGGATNITSPAHRLANNVQIIISGSGTAAYNTTFAVTRVDDDTFSIPLAFAGDPAVKGSWQTVLPRQGTERSENQVSLTVLGRNDAPTPAADTVATTEEQILRIMGDPDLIPVPPALGPAFDTDPLYLVPRAFATTSPLFNGLLANDNDPDDDDNPFRKLRIVGVAQAKAVTGYAGTAGQSPVTVTVAGHGLTSGTTVLISGYGGHASYNNYHVATVTGTDTFTIPVAYYVENTAQKGLAGVLPPAGRLTTTSAMGAAVTLEIRTSRKETNIIYNPRASATLNTLSKNQPAADSFYYVAEDSHGADAFAKVTVNVIGVNDAPLPQNDPGSVSALNDLITGSMTLRDVLAAAKVLYSIPSATPNRGTVTLRAGETDFILTGVPQTNEDTTLDIPAAELLANDSDIDEQDTKRITIAAGTLSREGAAVSYIPGSATVRYNPTGSARLNALAREEKLMDSFVVNITDNTASVTAIVAIEVTGRNDKPTALADSATIPEDQLLTLPPPGVLGNDRDPDQDTHLPDNRKVLIPAANAPTTVYGARINASVAAATGDIASFEAVAGNAALTKVNAPAHGLNTGEEIRIGGTTVEAYNGQFPVTRMDDNSFTIPLPSAAGAAIAGAGTWESLRSTLTYDPSGSVFNGSPGSTTFTLDGLREGDSYHDSWTYTMFDGSMVFANDDTFRVAADSTNVVLDVFANDVNLTGLTGALNIVAIGTPSQRGTAAIGGDNTIIYTPETSFTGDEFFTYTVMDAQGNTDTALVTVRVTIEQLNGNLQVNRDAFTVAKGQTPLLDVLANDDLIPATGAALTITRISTAPNAGGSAVIEGSGIRYTPGGAHAVYPYTETFAYEISGGGLSRAIATVTIQVANREGTLPLRPDFVSVQAGSSNNVLNVLANDNILPGSGLDLLITAKTTPASGTVQISADNKRLTFTPAATFIGTTSFTYTAGDGLGGTGAATVTVVVGGLTTNNDFFTVASATATPVTLDVLANDRVLGSPGTISIKAMAPVATAIGTLSVTAGAQSLTFTPVAGQTGERAFTYTIQDGTGREATGSLTVFASGPGLLANSDFFTVQAGSTSIELDVLLNDVQIPDLGLPKSIVGTGTGADGPDQGGTATPSATADKIIYTPAENFTGEERFTYSVTNGDTTAVAQVIVRVSDGALLASNDAYSVFKGSSQMRLEVLANDRVLPSSGQTLGITGIGIVQNAPGQQGTVAIAAGGSALLYTPNPNATNFPYTESFTYEISDGTARRAQATVSVEVLNRAGVREMETNDDAFTILAGGQNILLAVLANDDIRPAAATGWAITGTGAPNQGGSATIAGTAIAYTPRAGFVGTETFAYTVTDGLGGTGTATVTVKVGDVSVSDDVFSVLSGTSNNQLDVLANDGLFPDGFPDSGSRPGLPGFTLSTSPMTPDHGGTATVSGDHIVYRPATNFSGEETFTYRVQDDSGIKFPGKVTVNVELAGSDRSSAVLTINVTGVNDPPVFVNPQATATNDRSGIYPFANATLIDVDNQRTQRITVRVTWPAVRGTLTGGFTAIGAGIIGFVGSPAEATAALRGLLFTPAENRIPVGQTEETVFTVTLNDGFVSSPVLVDGNSTTVTPVNDPPMLTGTVGGQLLYQHSTLRPFVGVNLTDADNLMLQPLTVSVKIDSPAKGFLSNTGGFVQQPAGSGIYLLTGTPAAVAAALRGIVFEPTPGNRITPSQPETSTFTITVNDGFAPPLVDVVTTVVVLHAEVDRLLPLNSANGQDASQVGADFGESTALSGDTLVIGSPRRDSPLVDAGAVHVYERNAGLGAPWGQVAVLAPSDLRAGDRFGEAVAIHGDVLVAAAPQSEQTGGPNNTGAVYVFRRNPADRNAWLQVIKLLPPVTNGGGGDMFGSAVAVFGTTIFVGAPNSNIPGESNAGRVHIFEKDQGGADNWGLAQSLIASDERSGDNFGESIGVDGNTAVIGASDANRLTGGSQMGAAYILERPAPGGAWTETRKLTAFNDAEAKPFDHFGFSVDIERDTILIGASRFDAVTAGIPRPDSGAAFLFERNTGGPGQWGLTTKIVSPDAQPSDLAGYSVALSGDLCLIGAPIDSPSANSRGFVNVHRRHDNGTNPWGRIDRLIAGTDNIFDRHGFSVTLDGFTGAAGTMSDNGAGSAHVYQFQYDLGPRHAIRIPDQAATENQPFLFALPAMTFGDPVYGGALTLSATRSDGSPLPAGGWLSFNGATDTFSGTPVPANNVDYMVVVRATNPLGSIVVSNAFAVRVVLDPSRALQRAYAEWAATRFSAATLANPGLEATVWGPLANPDRDGAANLHEMLFGTPPQTFGFPPLTLVKHAGPQISATFPWAQGLPLEFIHVEWSTSLQSWQRQSVGYTLQIDTNGQRWITATVYPDSAVSKVLLRIAVGL